MQRCDACDGWQWGPEWCCHRCHSFDLRYEETAAEGVHLQPRARLAPGAPGAGRAGPVHHRAGRTAARRQRAHGRQPARRPAAGRGDRSPRSTACSNRTTPRRRPTRWCSGALREPVRRSWWTPGPTASTRRPASARSSGCAGWWSSSCRRGSASLSPSQWNRTMAASPTTRIDGSSYFSDRNFDFPAVAFLMNVALSSTWASEWL